MTTYLDSASGEPLHPAAKAVLEQAIEAGYADPRRLHGPARNARIMLDNARAATAEALGVRPDEVTFTPSGTHAVHLGLLGLLKGRARRSDLLVLSAVEHASLFEASRWSGGSELKVPVDRNGRVDTAALTELLDTSEQPAAVVAVQHANHEVGTVQPIDSVVEALHDETPLFIDACASAGRLDLPGGWQAAALSAHKWGGPAGVGVLLLPKGAQWRNPFPGDDRIDERTVGFENVSAALAAAAALQAVVAERDQVNARQFDLIDRLRAGVAAIPDTEVVGDPVDRLPHLVTFSFLYVDGESIVGELDRRGFAVASGSACTASTLEPSHVLTAMGALTHGNLRVSVGRETTEADVDRLLAALPGIVADIRKDAGL